MLDLVFDLDGTLIDSLDDLAASASELVVSRGGRPLSTDAVAQMVGDGAPLLVRRALHAAGLPDDRPDALPQFLTIYDRRMLEHTREYVGVSEMLQLVSRRARLSVLTNKPLAPTRQILEQLQLTHHFKTVIGGDGRYPRKPDPAGLSALISTPGNAALVGDSPLDAQTATNVGCAFVWARYGFGAVRFTSPPRTPFILDRPADLAGVLPRLEAMAAGT